jgi:hypothetical protein
LVPGAVRNARPGTGYGLSPKELADRIPRRPTGFRGDDGRWHEVVAGPLEDLSRLPDLPPPEPMTWELIAASEERDRYFRYLAARNKGRDVKPPPPAKFPHLWDRVGGLLINEDEI